MRSVRLELQSLVHAVTTSTHSHDELGRAHALVEIPARQLGDGRWTERAFGLFLPHGDV